jgi:hypothetical protein
MGFLTIWTSSFENLCSFLLAIFSLGHCILGSLVFDLPTYSGYQFLVRCIPGKDFLPFCGQPLQFRDHFFCCADTF